MRYKAFLSYSHAADGKLAPALQRALQGFAKPWYRVRTLKVFRDKTSLSANPGLWPSIQGALQESEFFLLLASPEAAASAWVQREVGWWLENRSASSMFLLLTDGEIAWDGAAGEFDWPRTSALPPLLTGRFPDEPLHVDLRWARTTDTLSLRHSQFRGAVLDVAAPLLARPKEDLDGDDVRQHRRNRAMAWAASLAILAFGVWALIGQGRVGRANEALQLQVKMVHLEKARTTSRQAAMYLSSLRTQVATIARTLEPDGNPREGPLRRVQALERHLGSESAFLYISVVNTGGSGTASGLKLMEPGVQSRLQEAYAEAREGQPTISEPVVSTSLEEPLIVIAEPVRRPPAGVQGVVAVVASLALLSRMMRELGEGGVLEAYIVDQRGQLLAHSDPNRLKGNLDVSEVGIVKEFLRRPSGPSLATPFEIKSQARGWRMLGTFAAVPATGWAVVVQLPEDQAYFAARF